MNIRYLWSNGRNYIFPFLTNPDPGSSLRRNSHHFIKPNPLLQWAGSINLRLLIIKTWALQWLDIVGHALSVDGSSTSCWVNFWRNLVVVLLWVGNESLATVIWARVDIFIVSLNTLLELAIPLADFLPKTGQEFSLVPLNTIQLRLLFDKLLPVSLSLRDIFFPDALAHLVSMPSLV